MSVIVHNYGILKINNYFCFYSSTCPILKGNFMKKNSAKNDNKKFWEEQPRIYLSIPCQPQGVRKINLNLSCSNNFYNIVIPAKIYIYVIWLLNGYCDSTNNMGRNKISPCLYLLWYCRYRCVHILIDFFKRLSLMWVSFLCIFFLFQFNIYD